MAEASIFSGTGAQPGRHGAVGADGPAALQIRERSLDALVQITTWGQGGSVRDLLGQVSPDQRLKPGQLSVLAGGVRACQLAPDRVWLQAETMQAVRELTEQLDAAVFSELDLSSSRVAIEINGPAVEDLMARLVTVDCALVAFAPDSFVVTALHEVSVQVVRESVDTFAIWIPITWAGSLMSYICTAAEPFGYEVAPAA